MNRCHYDRRRRCHIFGHRKERRPVFLCSPESSPGWMSLYQSSRSSAAPYTELPSESRCPFSRPYRWHYRTACPFSSTSGPVDRSKGFFALWGSRVSSHRRRTLPYPCQPNDVGFSSGNLDLVRRPELLGIYLQSFPDKDPVDCPVTTQITFESQSERLDQLSLSLERQIFAIFLFHSLSLLASNALYRFRTAANAGNRRLASTNSIADRRDRF